MNETNIKNKELDHNNYQNMLEKQSLSENSFLDYENLEEIELISRYVMETTNKGHFLPYEDYDIIKKWMSCSDNIDHLLAVLDEVFEELHINADQNKIKRSNLKLKNINKKVLNKLKISKDIFR